MTNVNGNDEQIKENGGEIITDEIENIKLISKEEYENLNNEEKSNWVKYNPSLQSMVYNEWLNTQNQMADMFNQLGPMVSKLSPLTGGGLSLSGPPIGMQQLLDSMKSALDAAQSVGSILESITQPLSVVGLSAIKDIFTTAFQLVGALAGMVYATVMNPMNMIAAYYQAIKEIDIDNLQSKFEGETTPNLDVINQQMKEIVIPDKEIKQVVDEHVEEVENIKNEAKQILDQTKTIEETMTVIKQADDTYQTYLETMATMGLNWLNIGTEEAVKAMKVDFEKIAQVQKGNPYTENAYKMSNSVNNFINSIPEKYIKVSDLEKLKNAEQSSENS